MAVECPSSPRDPGKTEDIPARRLAGADVRDAPPDPADVPSPSLATGPRLAGTALLVAGLATLAAATILSDGAPALDSRRVLVDLFENRTEELELVRRARTLYPDDLRIREREFRALASLGHLEELVAAITEAERVTGRETGYAIRGFALRRAAEDLMAHGHEELSRNVYRRAIDWNRKRLTEEGFDEKYQRLELLIVLRAIGELDAADDELELHLAEHPDDPWVLSRGAQLRAQQGRREAAFEFIDRYVEVTGRAGAGLGVTALLEDRETAMRRLREIEQTQGVYRPWLRHTPLLDSLRDYPPFQEFVRPKG